MATAGTDILVNNIKIWNVATVLSPSLINTFTGHTDRINALEQLQNGYLASASNDNSIKIWNLQSSSLNYSINSAHGGDNVLCLKLLSNGYLASGGGVNDKTIKIWNMNSYSLVMQLSGHSNRINALELLFDKSLASGKKLK